jgi:hypothetical protein
MVHSVHHDRAFSWLTRTHRAAAKSHVILTGGRDLTVWHGGISKMVRCAATKPHVMLTSGRDLTVWHGGISEMVRCAAAKPHVILTGGRDLTVWHGGISEMVRFTHHDSGFHWFDDDALCCNRAAMAWRNQ